MQAFMQTSGAPLEGRFPPELFPNLAAFLRTPKIIVALVCETCGGKVWRCVLCKEVSACVPCGGLWSYSSGGHPTGRKARSPHHCVSQECSTVPSTASSGAVVLALLVFTAMAAVVWQSRWAGLQAICVVRLVRVKLLGLLAKTQCRAHLRRAACGFSLVSAKLLRLHEKPQCRTRPCIRVPAPRACSL